MNKTEKRSSLRLNHGHWYYMPMLTHWTTARYQDWHFHLSVSKAATAAYDEIISINLFDFMGAGFSCVSCLLYGLSHIKIIPSCTTVVALPTDKSTWFGIDQVIQ